MSIPSVPDVPDPKFFEADEILTPYAAKAERLSNAELRPSATAFEDNCLRAVSPLSLIPSTIYWSSKIRDAEHRSGTGGAKADSGRQTTDTFQYAFASIIQGHNYVAQADPEKSTANMRELCLRYGDILTMVNGVNHGLSMVLASIVLNAWTAFEVAATDLWVAAVTARPDTLGVGALFNKHTLPDSDRSNKTVLSFIGTLIGTKQQMPVGSMVKEASRFNFNRLEGIKSAYETAFGGDGEALFADPVFEDLKVLEGIRNVLVHRAGIADAQHRKRIADDQAHYERLGLAELASNGAIQLDRYSANALLVSVFDSGNHMFDTIDEWLDKHPS